MAGADRNEGKVTPHGRALTISPEATVERAAKKMRDHDVGCLVVTAPGGQVVGILTERDVIVDVVAKSARPADVLVRNIMTPEVISCAPGAPISKARKLMSERRVRHLPIIDEGMVMGMISSRDILAHELSRAKAVVHKQNRILQNLERAYPGITCLKLAPGGRVVV